MKTMRQSMLTLLFGAFLLAIAPKSQAQHFSAGDINASAGTSVFHIGAMNMPLVVSGEYAVMDYLGAGAYLGYGLGIRKDYWPYYDGTEWAISSLHVHNFMAGAQLSFHFWDMLEGVSSSERGRKMDVFATGYGGLRLVGRTVAKDRTAFDFPVHRKGFLGLSATCRYYFKPTWAAFLELGRTPSGYVAFGVTFKVK